MNNEQKTARVYTHTHTHTHTQVILDTEPGAPTEGRRADGRAGTPEEQSGRRRLAERIRFRNIKHWKHVAPGPINRPLSCMLLLQRILQRRHEGFGNVYAGRRQDRWNPFIFRNARNWVCRRGNSFDQPEQLQFLHLRDLCAAINGMEGVALHG